MPTKLKVNDTKAIATHFRNDPRFGRTTTLIEKKTGKVLFVVVGPETRKGLFKTFLKFGDDPRFSKR